MSSRSQPFIAPKIPPPFSFGPYMLDLNRGALLRGSDEVKLRPKSYETLKHLVVNSGRLIPKTELISVLWPDAVSVSDDSVMHCIRDVRRALGDDGQELIRTVPGRGYMFVVPVEAAPFRTARVQEEQAKPQRSAPAPVAKTSKRVAAALVATLAVAGIGWAWKSSADRNWAHASVARVKQLASEGKYLEGYELALQVLRSLPGDPTVTLLLSELSDSISVSTTPPGAEVFLRRLGSSETQRLGVTPIQNVKVARGEFIISIRKAGFAGFERTLSSTIDRMRRLNKTPWDMRIEHPLRQASQSPKNMAFVPGGAHRLRGYSRTSDASAKLDDYFIDKFEVSNHDFKAFIDAGGYNKRQLWPSAEVTVALKDKTRLPGPRGWVAGTFPDGKQTHPVTGVSWYEASAYCQSQGKDLPTLFQWERAARSSMHIAGGIIFPYGLLDPRTAPQRANFESSGTTPVDSFEFGMSHFGVYNMAGNVMEWVRNPYDDGYATAGGAWSDPIYQFGHYGQRPALRSDETVGFRCAVTADRNAGDQGAMAFASNLPVFQYRVSTEREFQASKARYVYEKTPLNIAIVAVEETPQWRREEIAYDSYGERAKAFLYLPKNPKPPYQVIHFLGGDNWFAGAPVTDIVEGSARLLASYIRGGRAVFLVVLKGFAGREPVGAYLRRDYGSTQRQEILTQWATDMRRGLDYLGARPEIDSRKITFWNSSTYPEGAVFAALDDRYSAAIFTGAGLSKGLSQAFRYVEPHANPLHFFPHIRAPKLMLHGLYDEVTR